MSGVLTTVVPNKSNDVQQEPRSKMAKGVKDAMSKTHFLILYVPTKC